MVEHNREVEPQCRTVATATMVVREAGLEVGVQVVMVEGRTEIGATADPGLGAGVEAEDLKVRRLLLSD